MDDVGTNRMVGLDSVADLQRLGLERLHCIGFCWVKPTVCSSWISATLCILFHRQPCFAIGQEHNLNFQRCKLLWMVSNP